jgi:ligand-binding sensor protein
VLNLYINQQEEANKQVVKELWPGDQDVLKAIQSVMQKADKWIGSGLLKKIKDAYHSFRK